MLKIGVLVSGGGTNLQALIDAISSKKIGNAKIVTVVSSNKDAFALERAKKHGIESVVISRKMFSSADECDEAITLHMKSRKVDLIVMAGYLSIVGKKLINEFENKIINIHPSLIPSFCGKGFYGIKVHEKVLEYGAKVTGATVHFVNEIPDGGAIILQKAVEVLDDDSPSTLQKRVMEMAEWEILPYAVSLIAENRLKIDGRKVTIKEEV